MLLQDSIHSWIFHRPLKSYLFHLLIVALPMSSVKYEYGGGGGSERNSVRKWV